MNDEHVRSGRKLNGEQNGSHGITDNNTMVRDEKSRKFQKIRTRLDYITRPIRTRYNQLPENASTFERFKYGLLCPPHGNVAKYVNFVAMFLVMWALLLSVLQDDGLPGKNIFSIAVLFFSCVIGGYLVSFIRLPPLLGMLIVGCLLRNIPVIDVIGINIENKWSSVLRKVALTVILIRAGLGLDQKALRRLSWSVIRLAFLPSLAECAIDTVVAHFLLDFPWVWALMLGFVLAAVSPAVVVPSTLNLAERGYGLNKGIPTMIIAAASLDAVQAITGLGVMLGIAYSTAAASLDAVQAITCLGVMLGIAYSTGDLAFSIIKGPLGILFGVLYGISGGVFLWFIPSRYSRHVVLYRTYLLMGLGLMVTFGSSKLGYPGAGPLGCLSLAFVAKLSWSKEEEPAGGLNPMLHVTGIFWMVFQPLLFGLIGSEVDFLNIDRETVGLGLATLGIGEVLRLTVAFLTSFGTHFNWKERFFIPMAWSAKATVQAAVGANALDKAREMDDPDGIVLGKHILTVAVLSIIIFAPIGAFLFAVFGPRFLHQTVLDQELSVTVEKERRSEATSESKVENVEHM